jgi:hypothetical protein
MNKNPSGTIILCTLSALALWRGEILGQFSDGMWENAAPAHGPDAHWRFWHSLDSRWEDGTDVVVMNPGGYVPWRQKTGYNIAALYEHVEDRMLAIGRMARAFEALELDVSMTSEALRAAQYMPDTMVHWVASKATGTWSYDFVGAYMNHITADVALAYYTSVYTRKDLKEDVKHIKRAMHTLKK